MASSSSNTSLVGIDLFKSEVTKVLRASKDHKLEICHFKLAYENIFGSQFNHLKYGFVKKKLTTYFDDISDIVSFEKKKAFVKLKTKANDKQEETAPSQASQSSKNSRTSKEKLLTDQARRTSGSSVSINNSLSSKGFKNNESQGSQQLSRQAVGAKDKPTKIPEKEMPIKLDPSDSSLPGIDEFKSKVTVILQDIGNTKVELGLFKSLYKRKFKTQFNAEVYGFDREMKISELLQKIPDVVLLEKHGSSVFMKMNKDGSWTNESVRKEHKKNSASVAPEQKTVVNSQSAEAKQTSSLTLSPKEKELGVKSLGRERFPTIPGLFESLSKNSKIDSWEEASRSQAEQFIQQHNELKSSVFDSSVASSTPETPLKPMSSLGLQDVADSILALPSNLSPRTTGLLASPMITGLPVDTRTTGFPVDTRTTGLPVATRTTGLPVTTRTTGLPVDTRTTGLPVDTRTTGLLVATRTTGLPVATRTTGLPVDTRTTDLPVATRTTGLPVATRTTGHSAVPMIAGPSASPRNLMNTKVPSFISIMNEQEADMCKEKSNLPSLPSTPPTTFRRAKNMDSYRHWDDDDDDDLDEQACSGTPGPFEKSFNSAHETVLSDSLLKKGASRKLSIQEINEITKQERESISSEGHHVSLEIVKMRVCKRLGVKNLSELGYRKPDLDIQELKELSKLLCKLDLYCRAYVMVHGISTLTELGQGMSRLLEKKDFLDLHVGPLVKLPVVYELFRAPSDDVVTQEVTTVHILKHLNQYLTKKDKWTSRVDLQDFMQYLCDEYGCSTPYELGVRIQSIGLGIAVLKRAKKSQSEKSKDIEKELAIDMERELEKRCKKIKDGLLGSSYGDERSLLHKLMGSSVVDIFAKVFDHCEDLFTSKPLQKVNHFLKTVTSDKSFRDLFCLAIHMSCKDIVKDVLEDCKAELIEEERKNQRAKETQSKPPDKRTLVKEAKDWISAADDLDLSTLARIEKRVLSHFPGFDVFFAFGYGTWLEFLTSEKELYKLLENCGGSFCGESKTGKVKVDLNNILDFVLQCGLKASEDLVQCALCQHHHVPSITDLGVKSYDALKEQSLKRKHVQQSVIYELALLCKDNDRHLVKNIQANSKDEAKPKAGLLGWKSTDDGVRALASTPLLANMNEWTQWNVIFKPCLGDLKEFIEQESLKKRDDGIHILALETEEGDLLKVNTNVDLKDFEHSVNEQDVIGTAGNLVSLVIKYGGIQATPLTLMINHIRSALLMLASIDQKKCGQFVLQCLCRIPHRMCVVLASKVFLEPLEVAVGTGLSNQLLLSCCDDYKQRCCLHQLGLILGHTEWTEDFKSMITGHETERQVLEDERKKIFQDLRPVAAVKTAIIPEPCIEQEKEEPVVEAVVVEPCDIEDEKSCSEGTTSEGQASEDEEEVADNIPEDPCKTLIETIRTEEFGIGVNLGEEEGKLVQKQREREGRSLHRLSAELYSRDTHFVLELIQNADDNTFTSDTPTLMFIIDPRVVMVLNNEVGFQEENIRALCDVGKSTKGAHQYGYIGQKGIGFKSVFRVSDRPEVHSNGYHICFDANSGPSGYILPHWIDEHDTSSFDMTKLSSDLDTVQPDRWMTRIVLPLKEEFHGDKKNSLSARFNDVHPSLLLFLHRLRSIVLVKKNEIQQMKRQDLDDDIIQITDSHGTNRWLVVKKQLNVIEARENVEMTELALAFPMPKEERMASHESHCRTLPAQNVFAYLPLRSYGFKFIIQGDFEVPSSREDVDGDKAWNQWLREEIPKLFIDALHVFKSHPQFSGLSGVAKFFQFVPLKEEILDFFNPVAEIILRHLQGMNCLPVEKVEKDVRQDSNKRFVSQYDWMQPCKVVICEDPEIMTLISPELLHKHLALHYLAHDLISALNPALQEELGVKTLSVKHLIEVGKSVMKDDMSGIQDKEERVQWIARWLCCVYRCLEREHNSSSEILDEISAMKVFPLTDYTFGNLKENAIFFPLSINKQTMKEKKKRQTAKYLQELEKDLLVLNPELLSHLGSVSHSQVEKLLHQLGVKSWTAKDVIHNHILPTLKSDGWKGKTNDVLQSYLVYIFSERLSDPGVCDLDELKDCAQVLTNKGPLNPCKAPVHFTLKYGNPMNLTAEIPNISWTLIADSYLNEIPTSTTGWETFFSALGVQHFLIIKRRHVTLNKMTLETSPWASYCESWPETSDGSYVIEDFCCEELDEFMNKQASPQQAKVLAKNLDQRWKDHYSNYADKIPVKDTEGRELHGHSTLSSFLLNLKTKAWLPVMHCTTCDVPSKLYLRSDEVYDILDDHVHYVDVDLQDASFAKELGLTLSVTLDSLLDHLKGWSSSYQSENSGREKGFVTSLEHMKNVYQYIYEKYQTSRNDDKAKITSAFQKNPLIFTHRHAYAAKENPQQKAVGDFYHKKEVCWKDPSDVARQLLKSKKYTAKRQILSACYKKLHDFFRICLNVDLTPHSDEYIEMASVLVSENPLPTPSVLGQIIEIFAVLGEKCLKNAPTESNYTHLDSASYAHTEVSLQDEEINPDIANYLKTKLDKEDIFPCATRWVSLSDKPIIADSKRLKKVFEHEKDVHFIVLEQPSQKSRRHATKTSKSDVHAQEKKLEFVKLFLKACAIPKLSVCVEEKLTANAVTYGCHETQQYFHQIVPCVQRYLYHQMPEVYANLMERRISMALAGMTFAIVDSLEVVYHLENLPLVTVRQEAKCGFEYLEDKIFFYAVSSQVEVTQLNHEITKLFGVGGKEDKKFENFLELLQMYLQKDLESFLLNKQDVESLPQEEEEWSVPAPEIPKTPEIVDEEVPELIFPAERTEYENDGALHCWPPRAPVAGAKSSSFHSEQRPQEKALQEMWPVPEAPDSIKNQVVREEPYTLQANKPSSVDLSNECDETSRSIPKQDNSSGNRMPTTSQNRTINNVENCVQKSTEEPDKNGQKITSEPEKDSASLPVEPAAIMQESNHPCLEITSHQQPTNPERFLFPDFLSNNIQVSVEDLEFETLPAEDMPIPQEFSANENPNKEEIGRWGEQFVYEYLKKCLEDDNQNALSEVKWMNEQRNSTAPYDIEIKQKNNGTEQTVTYIEVKSTSENDKQQFEISAAELKFAFKQGKNLHLYRVFNAGNSSLIRILRVKNLVAHLEKKTVRVFMII